MLLYLPKVDIPTSAGWVHLQSSWFVSMTPDVTSDNAVWASEDDEEHLTSITCDYDFLPDVTYYTKTRIICNNGIIESDVGIIKVKDPVEISFKYKLPSIVVTPTIEIDTDVLNTPNSMFRVSISDISTTSNSELEYVTYLIETMNGAAVYSSLVDKDNLHEKLFNDVILECGLTYVLKVSHHSTSGDSSPFAELVFNVPKMESINVISNLENIELSNGYGLLIAPVDDYDSMGVTLYATGLGEPELLKEVTTSSYSYNFDSSLFTSKSNKYMLGVSVTKTDGTKEGVKYYELNNL